MDRGAMIRRVQESPESWDVIVIGGGATGVGAAVDAAARGYRTILVEQSDFGKGTSSRSTKLAHGGVRYLKQGNLALVTDALRERGLMRQNAPHLVHDLAFVVPNYEWWEAPFYGIGLRVYDMLAGKLGFGKSRNLSRQSTLERIPTIETKGLIGGVVYYDGQFDDARLVINLAQTAVEQGAVVLNYLKVIGLQKTNEFIDGVIVKDQETGAEFGIRGKAVINSTGVFADGIRALDADDARPMVQASQGVHLVLDRSFLPGDTAIMVPHTDDGRVLFAIPWHDCVVIGTTDTPLNDVSLEPRPLNEEVDFLMSHAARYLTKDPKPADVLSIFAGLRPLVKSGDEAGGTAALSRDHTINISRSGLITIAGGKWTTYRHMGEDVVDQAAILGSLDERPCVTKHLNIHGYHSNAGGFGDLEVYGSDAPLIEEMMRSEPSLSEKLHSAFPYRAGQVVWAVRKEMARTVDDFLSRRTRALVLNARASAEMAPAVARIMAKELGRDKDWEEQQVADFEKLAAGYILS